MKRRVLIIGLVMVIVMTGGQLLSAIASANGWHFGMNATSNKTVSQGFGYTMAIKDDNSLWAWGSGMLGDGVNRDVWSRNSANTPVKIMDSVSSVAALRQRTFAITTGGDLYAWGSGALGDGILRDWERPALSPVWIMDSVMSVTSYDTSTTIGTYTTFAIKTDGSLWAWGMGQLGDGVHREMFGTNPAVTPVKIMDSVISVYTHHDRAYAIQTDGSLWAWGSTANGLLGCGTIGNSDSFRTTPIKIMDDVTSVYISSSSTMAIKTDSSLWAWGSGAIGDGVHRDYQRPLTTPAKIMDDVISVSESKVLKSDGTLWAWGFGIIGDGTVHDWERPVLTPVRILDSVATIIDTGYHGYSMAIRTDGSLWAWGSNLGGQLGDGTASGYDYGSGDISYDDDYYYYDEDYIFIDNDKRSPVMIIDSVVSATTFGYYFPASTVVIRTDGSLWAWGSNEQGQLGDGTTERRFSPVKILEGMNITGAIEQPGNDHTPEPETPPQPGATPEPPSQPGQSPDTSWGSGPVEIPVIPARESPAMFWLIIICVASFIVSVVFLAIHFTSNRR